MKSLRGRIVTISELSEADIQAMYRLMVQFYDNMVWENFNRDLQEKDYCVLLSSPEQKICGFSTQKLLRFEVESRIVHGVFSGDTIIHKDYWGSIEMFRLFARFFVRYAEQFPEFYWFLISKGYKTYRMLPAFVNEFYPNYRTPTPARMKEIMNTYGSLCYPAEYDPSDGVVHYATVKDRLKDGVADITEDKLFDPDIAFFLRQNPGYIDGDDLVCLASLKKENLTRRGLRFLRGSEKIRGV